MSRMSEVLKVEEAGTKEVNEAKAKFSHKIGKEFTVDPTQQEELGMKIAEFFASDVTGAGLDFSKTKKSTNAILKAIKRGADEYITKMFG